MVFVFCFVFFFCPTMCVCLPCGLFKCLCTMKPLCLLFSPCATSLSETVTSGFLLFFWTTDGDIRQYRFKYWKVIISTDPSIQCWLLRISLLGCGSHVFSCFQSCYIDFYILCIVMQHVLLPSYGLWWEVTFHYTQFTVFELPYGARSIVFSCSVTAISTKQLESPLTTPIKACRWEAAYAIPSAL